VLKLNVREKIPADHNCDAFTINELRRNYFFFKEQRSLISFYGWDARYRIDPVSSAGNK